MCGRIYRITPNVWNVINLDELEYENGDITFACCFKAKERLLEDCKNNKIIGFMIPNKDGIIDEWDLISKI